MLLLSMPDPKHHQGRMTLPEVIRATLVKDANKCRFSVKSPVFVEPSAGDVL
jgi:hypothetical protein